MSVEEVTPIAPPPPVVVISQTVVVIVFGVIAILILVFLVYLFYKLHFKAKVGKIDGKHIHKNVLSFILKKTPELGQEPPLEGGG